MTLSRDTVVVVDVGARWGVGERWATAGDDVVVYGFDPDADECDRLNRLVDRNATPRVEYVPVALGRASGTATLHLTAEPACSSLYPPEAALADTFAELACIRPTGTADVSITTLDEWCAARGVDHVDVMKVDTQGSELGVLEGATRALTTTSLLEVEVEFNPIYRGQPLFGDVDSFLRDLGFVLWRLDNFAHYNAAGSASAEVETVSYSDSTPHRSVGTGGQLYWAHALFVPASSCPASPSAILRGRAQRESRIAAAAGLHDLARWLEHAAER